MGFGDIIGNVVGSLIGADQSRYATNRAADAQTYAAQLAAEAQKFRPVGITTRFGTSQFKQGQYGPESAGYTLAPDLAAQREQMMAGLPSLLSSYLSAPQQFAPMGTAAQGMFNLGAGYLGTTPQEQAAKWMADQQALLAPSREAQRANVLERLNATGRTGLAVGGDGGMLAANPELAAMYNAQRMQDLDLAARATQGGMDYTKFGAGLFGLGGNMLSDIYGLQTAALSPYQALLGAASSLEALGQTPLSLGAELGGRSASAGANVGQSLLTGGLGAARTRMASDAYSPWAQLAYGAGRAFDQYNTPKQQQLFGWTPEEYGPPSSMMGSDYPSTRWT